MSISNILTRFLLSLAAVIYFAGAAHAVDDLSQTSPLYTEYNTFIKSQNFLELIAAGTQSVSVKVSFYQIDGTFQKAVRVDLAPQEQVDLDVNTLVDQTDTYGVVKVEFSGGSDTRRLQGRMAVYRLNDDGTTYSFAYVLPLRAPITGTAFATSNTFDAQGRGYVVPNWLSITNLSDSAQTFTHSLYAQDGSLVNSTSVTLNPNERRDLAAGNQSSEAVYLNQVAPANPAAPYLSSIIRYGSNTLPGGFFRSYSFAMPVFARAGTGNEQFMPISDQTGDCWTQSNWVEVVNVTSSPVTASLEFRDKNGTLFEQTSTTLFSRSQFHFNAGDLLDNRNSAIGTVKVSSPTSGALLAQSVVYYHSCNQDTLQTAYNIQGNTPTESPLIGSFNRFLAQENELRVYGVTGVNRTVTLKLNTQNTQLFSGTFDLSNFAAETLNLNDPSFGTTADSYGSFSLSSIYDDSMMAFNLRLRKNGAAIDFAIPIEAR